MFDKGLKLSFLISCSPMSIIINNHKAMNNFTCHKHVRNPKPKQPEKLLAYYTFSAVVMGGLSHKLWKCEHNVILCSRIIPKIRPLRTLSCIAMHSIAQMFVPKKTLLLHNCTKTYTFYALYVLCKLLILKELQHFQKWGVNVSMYYAINMVPHHS